MRKKTLLSLLIMGCVVGAAVAFIGIVQFKGNAVPEKYELFVSSRAVYGEVIDSLMPRLKHRTAFRLYAERIDLATSFKPGHYVLSEGMDVIQVARMLKLGRQTPVRVTFNNVRTPAQLAQRLARQIDADSASIMKTLTSNKLAAELGFDEVTFFSMFIPNTYEFYWTVSPEELVRRMKHEYDSFWTPERDAQRARSGLSRLEVMTLASIVNEETRQRDEMPRVAGVYINRLRIGMPLQADPTIKYALQDFGLRRILHNHLKFPSPYNTYINKGLPPSPICMPSVATIDAVLGFEQHDYLFFCARPTFDGHHDFARTFDEHRGNARAYSAALNRRNIK
ncbi:MAG: endolytic transglycosylase MltG [Alistipes sp.]